MIKTKYPISKQFEQWSSENDYLKIKTLDCHTGGEPLRIITSGFPELKGDTILHKRQFCKDNYDDLRKAIIFEPRGHADMYAALVVDAEQIDSDFGAIFLHNEGYSNMCGHAVIALTKFAVESGVVKQTGDKTAVTIDVPCGQIKATAYGRERIETVSFQCVPSFILYQDEIITTEEHGEIKVDVAFGGAFYAYLDVSQVNLSCDQKHYNDLIQLGRSIKSSVIKQLEIKHPSEPQLDELYGVIFIEDSGIEDVHSKNVCVFADGEVDRSPTGSGVSGRAAIHFAKGQIDINQKITIESILGSQFTVQAVKEVDYHGLNAIIPEVTGNAFISGMCEFIIDPNDPLKHGFILR
jgi:trans-L-3-hydroxyproline dehydratase